MQRGSLDALAARHGLKITFDGKQHRLVDRDTETSSGRPASTRSRAICRHWTG